MWTRQELKLNAKQELKTSYWLTFGVVVLANLVINGFTGGYGTTSISTTLDNLRYGYGYSYSYSTSWVSAIFAALFATSILAFIVRWAYSAFIGNIFEVGQCAYLIRAPYGDRRFNYLFYPFKNGRYMGVVKAQFKTQIIIFLWSLLFVVPGIVKSYQYRFVPYLLAENPELSADDCMALSRQMTDGQKMEMFVLDLSFYGWYLLGALACGIGMAFVIPYHEATFAQLYFVLRPRVAVPPAKDGFFAPADAAPVQYTTPQYPPFQQNGYSQQPGGFPQQPGAYPQQPGYTGQPYTPYGQPGAPEQPQQPPAGSPYNPAPEATPTATPAEPTFPVAPEVPPAPEMPTAPEAPPATGTPAQPPIITAEPTEPPAETEGGGEE